MKLGIIHIFLGELPPWFNLFIETCKYNNHLDFILLTDNEDFQPNAANIKTIFISKGLFEELATANLGFSVFLDNSYKLCEYKPAYGIIFQRLLKDYDYWGYCDNDLLFGDIEAFLPSSEIKEYDTISTYSNFMSGPFCIFRNTEYTNNLFRQIANYQKVYQHPNWCATEENFIGTASLHSYAWKIKRKIGFYFFNKLRKGKSLSQKYSNYWVYKREHMNFELPKDITEVVWQEQAKGNIKVLFKPLLKSDREYKREKQTNWEITWKQGKLFNKTSENEMFAFHFVDSKSDSIFKARFKQKKDKFSLTSKGLM